MRLTSKQIEIIQKISEMNADGSPLDLTQLRLALSYVASKQAILCSINVLCERGLIERSGKAVRNKKTHTLLKSTALGQGLVDSYVPTLRSALIEEDEEE